MQVSSKQRRSLRVFTSQALDFWLQKVSPTASVHQTLAQVVERHDEAPDVVTLILKPNHHWEGFQAGQHVEVTIEVDGRRLRRTWTLSGGAHESTLRLTIGKIPRGRVTGWIHEQLSVGTIVTLSAARGEFVLPAGDTPVVFVAGGVGITPALSMIRTLANSGFTRPFTLVHYARTDAHAIARDELERYARLEPNFRYVCIVTNDDQPGVEARRIHAEQLQTLDLELDTSELLVCGPGAFMDAARSALSALAPNAAIHQEFFTLPTRTTEGTGGTVHFASANQSITVDSEMTLLESAEAAGLTPAYGCRAGICMQCACNKASGVVVDIRNGNVLAEDNQRIQLCITRPAGPVVIDL